MPINVLYLLSSFNKFGGTPKKTMDLIKYSVNNCYLYVWSNAYSKEFKNDFINAGATIYEGDFKRNIAKHITSLLKIIDTNDIQIVQAQFFFGELLGGILKVLRPHLKLVIAFVGSVSPTGYKKHILSFLYTKVDTFVFISNYVKKEKERIYPKLKHYKGVIIYNGTTLPEVSIKTLKPSQDQVTILCVSSLLKIKNIEVLIDCCKILVNKGKSNVKFLVAGDGSERNNLEKRILENKISDNFKLLGHQKHIGDLHNSASIFVHPCYIEGFGIAVAEAMLHAKPIVASNAGALPELISNDVTGILVNPFDPECWSNAIIKIIDSPKFANKIAINALEFAKQKFSVERFTKDYDTLHQNLLPKS